MVGLEGAKNIHGLSNILILITYQTWFPKIRNLRLVISYVIEIECVRAYAYASFDNNKNLQSQKVTGYGYGLLINNVFIIIKEQI